MEDFFNDSRIQSGLWLAIITIGGIGIPFFVIRFLKKSKIESRKQGQEITFLKQDNISLREELRQRITDHINFISRIILLHPVIPGNTPEDNSLEGRNRAKCLALLVEGLPRDTKGQGIRMAEFLHHLSDHLLKAYGKEEEVTVKIEAHPIILDVESAVSVGLMLNELISNAFQYAPVPGEKCKVNIFFKERDHKLVISVGDNGIGMKVPYLPKYSFGLQLTSTLVKMHKGDMIISSRPGTRVEILLPEYKKAIREVYITPTTKIH